MKLCEDRSDSNETDSKRATNGETRIRHALHRMYREMLATSSTSTNMSYAVPEDRLDVGNDTSSMDDDKLQNDETYKLYLYGTPPLILFCIISIAINVKILVSVYWIRRPLSPTLHISLSLAGADAFSSIALGVGLVMNSFLPVGLGHKFSG